MSDNEGYTQGLTIKQEPAEYAIYISCGSGKSISIKLDGEIEIDGMDLSEASLAFYKEISPLFKNANFKAYERIEKLREAFKDHYCNLEEHGFGCKFCDALKADEEMSNE